MILPSDFQGWVRKAMLLLLVSPEASWWRLEPPRSVLIALKPPCCEEAQTRPSREIPRPSSETKPRGAWPATSCCIHTHTPTCLQLQPVSEMQLHERPEPETPSRALLIEPMRGEKVSIVDIKPLNLGAVCYAAIDQHRPHCPFPPPCQRLTSKEKLFLHWGMGKGKGEQ